MKREEYRLYPGSRSNMDTNSESPCKTKIPKTTPKDSKVESAVPQKEFSKKNKNNREELKCPA